MYVQYLANSHKAPSTVKNYLSGARLWIKHHRGSDLSFSATEVIDVLKSNINFSLHVPTQAPALTPHHILIICTFLNSLHSPPPAFKAALLIGYTCFLRSSNLLSPSVTQWGGPHTLRCSDISLAHPGLIVKIRSSKTLRNSQPVILAVAPVPNILTCPVRAWTTYLSAIRPSPSGPAFMLDSLTPLTP